ncbi:MAG: Curli production assembly/transport component CsgG [Planctomycetes bacterium ADurb.Bin126]|nr:MAG: Curli production assembly/transport component CsgG [Planctomycetes bacterium ADurb.Bin126]HOD80467.1 CsgG/HfaB family protein [Phycisphaerae bacterium]HQL72079.1 CsgG/HfaB family protein [Phycisphaerae bacterium]
MAFSAGGFLQHCGPVRALTLGLVLSVLAGGLGCGQDATGSGIVIGFGPETHQARGGASPPKAPPDESSRGGVKAPPVTVVTCDVRVVAADQGSAVANAHGETTSDRLDALAKALAGKLREGVLIKGESIAVVSLRNRSKTSQGAGIAEELADKLQGALIDSGWFDVKERIDLRALIDEKTLESADIVRQAGVKQRLAGVKYIVLGGVSAAERTP